MATTLAILLLLAVIWVFIGHMMEWRRTRTVMIGLAVIIAVSLTVVLAARAIRSIGAQHQRANISGTWHAVEEQTNGVVFEVTTTIDPDGSLKWAGSIETDGKEMDIRASGTWELSNDSFIYEIERSNANPYFPSGHSETVTVDRISAKRLIYTDSAGRQHSEERIGR